MKQFFFYFSILGWILSLIVHLTAIIKDYDLTKAYEAFWFLHIGVFIAWFPAVLKLNQIRSREFNDQWVLDPINFLKKIFEHSPKWLTTIAACGFVYAFINFFIFVHNDSKVPDALQGLQYLKNYDEIARSLSDLNDSPYGAYEARGFSGHWLAFYGLAASILYPYEKHQEAA